MAFVIVKACKHYFLTWQTLYLEPNRERSDVWPLRNSSTVHLIKRSIVLLLLQIEQSVRVLTSGGILHDIVVDTYLGRNRKPLSSDVDVGKSSDVVSARKLRKITIPLGSAFHFGKSLLASSTSRCGEVREQFQLLSSKNLNYHNFECKLCR